MKIYSIFISTIVSISASLFTVTDRHGKVIKNTHITHNHNTYLSQKATEYSLQAIYDELHRDENLARLAQIAREHINYIQNAKELAKKSGKTYHISQADRQQLIVDAKYYKGGHFVWGGSTPHGFDCSGYVQYLYNKYNIHLPRTALAQSKKGKTIDKSQILKGDLLFFLTDKKRGIPITHVGIYLGNGKFIHAASKKRGIIISPLNYGHYANTFVLAKRVLKII